MTTHHPSDETLLRFATGALEAGPGLIVRVHLEGCSHCGRRVAAFEAVGGSLLDEMEPADMAADALDRALARIEADQPAAPVSAPIRLPRAELGIRLPDALDGCGVAPWRWLGPGVRWSRVTLPESPSSNVMLLKVAAGRKLPEHSHAGREYTHVLTGSFSDARGRYLPGDMDEADSEVEHQPIVDMDGECVCIAALEGQMRLLGFFGRMIQPFLRS